MPLNKPKLDLIVAARLAETDAEILALPGVGTARLVPRVGAITATVLNGAGSWGFDVTSAKLDLFVRTAESLAQGTEDQQKMGGKLRNLVNTLNGGGIYADDPQVQTQVAILVQAGLVTQQEADLALNVQTYVADAAALLADIADSRARVVGRRAAASLRAWAKAGYDGINRAIATYEAAINAGSNPASLNKADLLAANLPTA